jgi:hypothetical protein
MITQDRLKNLVSYNPETGEFTSLVNRRMIKAGQRLGYINRAGYYVMRIDGRTYYSHVIAWIYMNGSRPEKEVDHIDLNKLNNKWDNLRAATGQQNSANKTKRSDSKQPYKGIQPKGRKWFYYITVAGKRFRSGVFETPELAHAAYAKKAKEFFGEFARVL